MPTYAELGAESWWRAEIESPALAAFNSRLRATFGHTRAQTGSKGDNRHLRGRHRSRNWCLNSTFCLSRSYGTTDTRDKRGDGDWLRATDAGLVGTALREASARLDKAVKAGRLPLVAEWFGTIDGRTVTGWFQGHVSSSDDSHLYHLHLGYWTGMCDNADQFRLLGDIITGEDEDMATAAEVWGYDPNDDKAPGAVRNQAFATDKDTNATVPPRWALEEAWRTGRANEARLTRVETALDEILAALHPQPLPPVEHGEITLPASALAAIGEAVRAELARALAPSDGGA
jgi:hypothetical protein